MTAENRILLRGFALATLAYTAGQVVVPTLRRSLLAYAVVLLMWATFVAVTGRLALLAKGHRVAKAALVSSAAVLVAGLIRIALAAAGMRWLLIWDHDNVVAEAIVEQLLFGLLSLFPASVIAICTLLLASRLRHKRESG